MTACLKIHEVFVVMHQRGKLVVILKMAKERNCGQRSRTIPNGNIQHSLRISSPLVTI